MDKVTHADNRVFRLVSRNLRHLEVCDYAYDPKPVQKKSPKLDLTTFANLGALTITKSPTFATSLLEMLDKDKITLPHLTSLDISIVSPQHLSTIARLAPSLVSLGIYIQSLIVEPSEDSAESPSAFPQLATLKLAGRRQITRLLPSFDASHLRRLRVELIHADASSAPPDLFSTDTPLVLPSSLETVELVKANTLSFKDYTAFAERMRDLDIALRSDWTTSNAAPSRAAVGGPSAVGRANRSIATSKAEVDQLADELVGMLEWAETESCGARGGGGGRHGHQGARVGTREARRSQGTRRIVDVATRSSILRPTCLSFLALARRSVEDHQRKRMIRSGASVATIRATQNLATEKPKRLQRRQTRVEPVPRHLPDSSSYYQPTTSDPTALLALKTPSGSHSLLASSNRS